MPSYLATIRYEAENEEGADHVAAVILSRLNPTMLRAATVESVVESAPKRPCNGRLADVVPTTTDDPGAARALSPAVVDELRQMWRADARDEAKLAIRDFVYEWARRVIP